MNNKMIANELVRLAKGLVASSELDSVESIRGAIKGFGLGLARGVAGDIGNGFEVFERRDSAGVYFLIRYVGLENPMSSRGFKSREYEFRLGMDSGDLRKVLKSALADVKSQVESRKKFDKGYVEYVYRTNDFS
jgi:hypothetical protein